MDVSANKGYEKTKKCLSCFKVKPFMNFRGDMYNRG